MSPLYLVTIILFYLVSKLDAQNIGSTCVLENGLNGICQSAADCSITATLIRDRISPILCEFIAKEPIVCCPPNSILTNNNTAISFNRRKCSIFKIAPLQMEHPIYHLRFERASLNIQEELIRDIHNIVGGEKTIRAEFPHMARLGIGENETHVQWYCGGSLISDKYILTAAHCIYIGVGTINWALIGDPDAIALQKRVQITMNIIHPDYNYSTHYNDIAISEMKDSISFGFNIQPACLYLEEEMPVDVFLTVIGWGNTEFGGDRSKDLLKADVSLYTAEECKRKYTDANKKLPRGIDDEIQFCAGGRTEMKDTCQGDSGGPIQMKVQNIDLDHIYSIVGVTSFGKICGLINDPGVYTRVYPYLSWIERILKK